jgi:hypothetical protein
MPCCKAFVVTTYRFRLTARLILGRLVACGDLGFQLLEFVLQTVLLTRRFRFVLRST